MRAVSAIAFPFLIGALSAIWLSEVNDRPGSDYVAFVLFFGAAMSFTAFPVLAPAGVDSHCIQDAELAARGSGERAHACEPIGL
jgi:hypothetical protein